MASRSDREMWAEQVACRLDSIMTAAGVLFVLVVLGQSLAAPGSRVADGLAVGGWILWTLFMIEFLARLVAATSSARFLRTNWWQIIFLVVPFLRFARPLAVARFGRAGTVVSSAVRSSRTASGLLTSRIAWLATVSGIVVLAGSQLLYAFADTTYASALHSAAYAVINGQPIRISGTFARVLELVLSAYSVVVFASLAASMGAFYLSADRTARDASETAGPEGV